MRLAHRLRHLVFAVAVIACAATTAVPQSRPDFSGVWIPVEEPKPATEVPVPPGAPPPPPKTLSASITQSATEMKVDRRLLGSGRETVSTFIYKLDGTESINQMGPLVFRTMAEWQGDTLVLSSVVSADENPIGELRELYRLENGSLVVEGRRKSPAGTFTTKTVHKKG